jgi:hypothetical protein
VKFVARTLGCPGKRKVDLDVQQIADRCGQPVFIGRRHIHGASNGKPYLLPTTTDECPILNGTKVDDPRYSEAGNPAPEIVACVWNDWREKGPRAGLHPENPGE